MEWNTDAFFAQGKTHLVCEDYAKAGRTEEGNVYAIVCDGCSSSTSTDVGARLLAHCAAADMDWLRRTEPKLADREHRIISSAMNAATHIQAPMRCLDTTLVAARAGFDEEGNEGVRVSMRGDGVVVARERNGSFTILAIDHEHNAPRYLSYDLDATRLEGYMAKFGDKSLLRVYRSEEGWVKDAAEEFHGHHDDWFFAASKYDLVMVLSDGVCTFQERVSTDTSRTLVDVPLVDVVEQLLRIKVTKGKFLQRRCQKFLHHYCYINEWQHADDFSAAAIWMGDPE